jgi:glycosyltransferase involved in cell wall biosynthesis
MEKEPLLSIVTPSYNQGAFIEETLGSVLHQDYSHFEYIVIDGNSTDNTLAVIRRYGARIKWLSEPDRGQADAINKGFGMAEGEILAWINSDDTYHPGALKTVAEWFSKNPQIVMIYGEAHFIDRMGRITGEYPTEEFDLKRLADTCFICQPTVFMRAGVFQDIGLFDTNLHTCMDYDYWIRIGKYYPSDRIAYLKDIYLANSRMYDENKTIRRRKEVYKEVMKTQKKYFGRYSRMWIRGYIKEILLGIQFKTGE